MGNKFDLRILHRSVPIRAFLKLSPTLTLLDWYTPTNWSTLNAEDADFSSGPPFIPATGYVAAGIKAWTVYVINSNCMGQLGGTANGCTAPQITATGSGTPSGGTGIFGRMFMNNIGYFPNASGHMYGLTWTGTGFSSTPSINTTATYNTHSLMMAGSSNGASGKIVWGLSPNAGNYTSAATGTLRALNATTVSNSGTAE